MNQLNFKKLKKAIENKCEKYDNKHLMKWFNLKKTLERKAKTEINRKDLANMEDFETPKKVGPPTANALKQLPRNSISSTVSAFFKPVIVGGK